jgi:hypothetical protein
MSWNYRVMEFPGDDGPIRGIHEVYYDEKGEPWLYAVEASAVVWAVEDGDESPIELLEHMKEALSKPILRPSDFKNACDGEIPMGVNKV